MPDERRTIRGPIGELLSPVVEALDLRVTESVHIDPFLRDPHAVRRMLPLLSLIESYYAVEVRGWENLPQNEPVLVVGNHSGGAQTIDAVPFLARWVRERGAEAELYMLAYDLLFAYPLVGRQLPSLGFIPANRENARRALERNATVVVFPGGDFEVFRPWSERNRIELHHRTGFIEVALETGVRVVPMTIHGAHESTIVLTRGRWLAQRLGIDRLNVKVFPLILNIPLGITPAFVPTLPLPARITVQIGKPLDWRHHVHPGKPRSRAVDRCYREISGIMQETLDHLAEEDPYPILSRLARPFR